MAAIVAYAWVTGYIGFQSEKTGQQIELQSWTNQGNLVIYVQNTGQGTVHLKQDGSVYVNDVLKTIWKIDDTVIAIGSKVPINMGQTVKVEVNYDQFKPGDRIKVVTVEGTSMQVTGNSRSGSSSGGSGGSGGSSGSGSSTTYTITPSAETGGTITPSTAQQVSAGGSVTFTVTANTGYHIDAVYVDGSAVTLDLQNKYTFSNVQANHNIHATFSAEGVNPQNRYTITVTQTANGIINPGTSTYDAGATPSFTITPNNGYQIASITANGAPVAVSTPLGQTYEFSALSANGTLTATYSVLPQSQYTITVTQTDHGTITPGTTTVAAGASQEFTIIPDSGYHIASIVANGISQTITSPSSQSYTFASVSAPCTLTATYAANTQTQYTVSFAMGTGGQLITPPIGEHSYNPGTQVQLGATAQGSYVFQSWTTSNPTGLTFDNAYIQNAKLTVNATGTVTANFISTSSNKLVFVDSTTPQTLLVNQPSSIITVQRQTAGGSSYSPSSSLTVTLTATSGTFYSDAYCTKPITTITINSGQSRASFYYQASATGSPIITASATSYQPVSTTFTINNPTSTTVLRTSNFDGSNWDQGWEFWSNPPWNVNTTQCYSSPNSVASDSSNSGAFSCDKLDATGAKYVSVTFQFRINRYTLPSNFQLRYGVTVTDIYDNVNWINLGVNLGDTSVYNYDTWHQYTINIPNNPAFTTNFRLQLLSNIPQGSLAAIYVDNIQITMYK